MTCGCCQGRHEVSTLDLNDAKWTEVSRAGYQAYAADFMRRGGYFSMAPALFLVIANSGYTLFPRHELPQRPTRTGMNAYARTPRQGDNGGVLQIGEDEFEALVAHALDTIPPRLARLIDNVAVFVEDSAQPPEPGLLGRYEGVPLTSRGQWYAGVLPDRITIYRLPILWICRTREEVAEQVRLTVVHEIAHHFGISDELLGQLGY